MSASKAKPYLLYPAEYELLTDYFSSDHSLNKSRVWVEADNFDGDPAAAKRGYPLRMKDVENGGMTEVYVDHRDVDLLNAENGSEDASEEALETIQLGEPYLIVGFDCEFKTPDEKLVGNLPSRHSKKSKRRLTAEQRERSQVEVLSYQFAALSHRGERWEGICVPEHRRKKSADGSTPESRISLAAFLTFVFSTGLRSGKARKIPKKIYLVGHFTRADLPLFSDFRETILPRLNNIRNTFVTIEERIHLGLRCTGGNIGLRILVRDTQLLTPATSKNLKSLGDLVGIPKLNLNDMKLTVERPIENMDLVRERHWKEFKSYAINDAAICREYLAIIRDRSANVTGNKEVPMVLSQIGVHRLVNQWKQSAVSDGEKPELSSGEESGEKEKVSPELDVIGRVRMRKCSWVPQINQGEGGYLTRYEKPLLPRLSWWEQFAIECYHGGRNEQFWYGPAYRGEWTDYDLSSAYPTAMCVLKYPDWNQITYSIDPEIHQPDSFSFAYVDFKFPHTVRFPVLPVRTEHGLIFPQEGSTYATGPEIWLARKLGCELKIHHGCFIPSLDKPKPFQPFITECISFRKAAEKGSLDEQFWKELTNSTYGKTAQGLKPKNVYDLREGKPREMSESSITNPFYAAFITGFVRAVLGEIMNGLPPDTCVFSVTTDGFLTDASEHLIAAALSGEVSKVYASTYAEINEDPTIKPIAKKHWLKRPLGVRTRFQLTLEKGTPDGKSDKHVLCATSGFSYRNDRHLTDEQRNDEAVRRFFTRKPNEKTVSKSMISVSEMLDHHTDLVEKWHVKRLNLEFDWKRMPHVVKEIRFGDYSHIAWSTVPLKNKDEFDTLRDLFESFDNAENKLNEKKILTQLTSEWETRKEAAADTGADFSERKPKKDSIAEYLEKLIWNIKDYASFYRYAEKVDVTLLLGAAGKERSHLRQSEPDLALLRMIICRALKQNKAGLKIDDSKQTSAKEWADFFTAHGMPTTRGDIQNGKFNKYRQNSFVLNQVPRTPRVMKVLRGIKADYPSLKIDELLTKEEGLFFLKHLTSNVECPLMGKFSPDELVPLPLQLVETYTDVPAIVEGSREHLMETLSSAVFRNEWNTRETSASTHNLTLLWIKHGWNMEEQKLLIHHRRLRFLPKLARLCNTPLPPLPTRLWVKTPDLVGLVEEFRKYHAAGLMEENLWKT